MQVNSGDFFGTQGPPTSCALAAQVPAAWGIRRAAARRGLRVETMTEEITSRRWHKILAGVR
jgi:hypothetical protein